MDANAPYSPSPILLTDLEKALLLTLIYFDVFRYPLTEEEIARCCSVPNLSSFDAAGSLKKMALQGWIGERDGFYFLGEEEGKIERRLKGNGLAQKRLKKARKVSRFIASFPFVRAVMLSGSLSKNYMEADSDIDYFIVTQPGRLWVARTMLVVYKKVFLLNSHKNFCVNYFVDENHLEIEDQNLFTATEVAFLLPTVAPDLYKAFRKRNRWVREHYPNFQPLSTEGCAEPGRPWWQRMGEWMLNGRLGASLDRWCMKQTLKRWESKFTHLSPEVFEVALRSRKYVSKHHPQAFQERVLVRMQEREQQLSERFNLEW